MLLGLKLGMSKVKRSEFASKICHHWYMKVSNPLAECYTENVNNVMKVLVLNFVIPVYGR